MNFIGGETLYISKRDKPVTKDGYFSVRSESNKDFFTLHFATLKRNSTNISNYIIYFFDCQAVLFFLYSYWIKCSAILNIFSSF